MDEIVRIGYWDGIALMASCFVLGIIAGIAARRVHERIQDLRNIL